MSGHSKWHSIKHRKAAADAKRGKLFTKLIKELTIAARMGGGDPSANPRLRTAIAAAKAASMPSDNIERAIRKGTGDLEGVSYIDVTYEGYGPAGVAIILECVTDNKNRTVAELRHAFSKNGGNLGENGSVSWMFERLGMIHIPAEGGDADRVFEVAVDAGATDVREEGEFLVVVTSADALEEVRGGLVAADIRVSTAELTYEPKSSIMLTGEEAARALRLVDVLEDHDDVQRVSANFDIDDEELKSLSV
jgi:YebC/PmpR family DNA-binding regulatory protein